MLAVLGVSRRRGGFDNSGFSDQSFPMPEYALLTPRKFAFLGVDVSLPNGQVVPTDKSKAAIRAHMEHWSIVIHFLSNELGLRFPHRAADPQCPSSHPMRTQKLAIRSGMGAPSQFEFTQAPATRRSAFTFQKPHFRPGGDGALFDDS
jgi:hypothetical protein